MLFHEVPGAQVVLVSKGAYRQVPLFCRGKQLFAKWGNSFIALKRFANGTSLPHVRWDEIEGAEFNTQPTSTGDANLVLADRLRSVAS